MEWYWILTIVLGGLLLLFALSSIFYKQFFKRFWDIVLSGLAIIVLSPLLLVLTIIGAIAMKGNPFFTQKRLGKKNKKGNEKIFKLIKFRTMSNKKDDSGNLLPDDQRLNKYGKFLRTTSLDELPELFNIFIGNMAIIGPRPLLVRYLPFYTQEERKRHNIRPGLTGNAQVNGRNNVTWERKFQLDIEYVSNYSLFFDIRLLFETALAVIRHKDVVEASESISIGDTVIKPLDVERENKECKKK